MNALGNTLRSVVQTALSLSIDKVTKSHGSQPYNIGAATLKVYRVEGQEAISEPFRYAIDFVRATGYVALTCGEVLGKDAVLEIKVTDGSETMPGGEMVREMVRRVHGVVEEFMVEEDPSSADGDHYRVVLVPRVAMLARNRQNRIHATSGKQTLEQIIRRKLLSSGPDYGSGEKNGRVVLEEDEFRIDIDDKQLPPLAELSHVAQYNETDLDFIRRLCESHGVYFFFASNAADPNDAEDTRGMVVFGNTNTPFGVIRFEKEADANTYKENHKLVIGLTLTGATGLADGSTYTAAAVGPPAEPAELEGALFEFKSVHQPTPAHLYVVADNGKFASYRAPQPPPPSPERGIYTDYDTHFTDEVVGLAFVGIRKQEIKAASEYSVGCTNSPCVAPGRTFTKKPDGVKFLVTAVDIEVRQAHTGVITEINGEVIQTGFTNKFRCIAFDGAMECVYRPPRVTPVPRLPGVQTAYIGTGATGEAGRPVLDEDGAYHIYQQFLDERVQFVDAEAELAIDKLSKAVRKGEPYAGDGVGMHFPLKRDTEVLVAYRNGDPDRPVIAAAMPGPLDHASPVTGVNPTSHVIETSSGARFEILDGYDDSGERYDPAASRVTLRSQESDVAASYVRLGKADTTNASDPETLEDRYPEKMFTAEEEEEKDRHGIALYTADNIREAAQKDKITEVKGTIRAHAGEDIYGRSVQKHLLRGRRMVIVSGGLEDEPDDSQSIYVQGNTIVAGPATATAAGNMAQEPAVSIEEVQIEDDDMSLLSKGNVYIKAHGDIHTTALASVTKNVGGDEIKRTSGDSIAHHYGNSSKYVRGTAQKLVLGANISHSLGFQAQGRLGGWLAVLGPRGGILYYGQGICVWAQLHFFHSVIMVSTTTLVECKNANAIVDKSNGFSIKACVLELRQAIARIRVSNCATRCCGNYTML